MGQSANPMTANPSPLREPSEDSTMVHPMRELLIDGGLTTQSRDRAFTTFFDLKLDYHKEFLKRLRQHVLTYGYRWEELLTSKDERLLCAESFLSTWGESYWGTETNRQTYLLEDALADPESLCVYPERQDEIAEALAILLERKAKSILKQEAASTPSAPLADRPDPPNSAPQPVNRKEENKTKRKIERLTGSPTLSDDEPRRSSSRRLTQSVQPIIPFRSIASPDRSHPERSKSTVPNTQVKIQDLITPSHPIETSPGVGSSDSSAMSTKTHFLVNISHQQGMAPIWIPFKKFPTTAAFLGSMLSECTLQYWNSSAQALSDVQPERLQVVVAASVKFNWSDFEIRIRQGKDQDWALFMAQLEKAWKESELSKDSNIYDGFRVLVMLHVLE